MQHPPLVLFHDGKGLLSPLTDLRASFDVRTGALTLRERVQPAALLVPAELEALTRELGRADQLFQPVVNQAPAGATSVVVVNGRCPLPPIETARAAPVGTAWVEEESGDLVVAHVAGGDVERVAKGDLGGLSVSRIKSRVLMTRPWHVRSFRDSTIAFDIAQIKAKHSVRLPYEGVVATGRHEVINLGTIEAGIVLDVSHGDIVVMQGAVVRPGAILIGPCYVGPGSTVLERATIRPNTAIGPTCKVNGEVGGTIFQGLSNKGHDGYLGDSWVGEWVNLGAGTTNSNLLNTYGEIICRATPDGKNERTGETFLGAIIGDHVKTAICSRIMTGSVLHMGSMFATTAPVSGCVGAFTWATDDATTGRPSHRPYRLDKFLEVMRAAMARRKVEATEAYLKRLGEFHALCSAGTRA